MRFRWHFSGALSVFIALWLLVPKITFSLILYPIIISVVLDLDFKFKQHRHILSHSIIIPLIPLIFNFSLFFSLMCFGWGLHCLMDVHFKHKKMTGFYCIKYWGKRRFSGYMTTFILLASFTVSLMILWWLIIA